MNMSQPVNGMSHSHLNHFFRDDSDSQNKPRLYIVAIQNTSSSDGLNPFVVVILQKMRLPMAEIVKFFLFCVACDWKCCGSAKPPQLILEASDHQKKINNIMGCFACQTF